MHASTAAFDTSTINGEGLTIDDTAAVAVDSITQPEADVDWRGSSTDKAIEVAIKVHSKYCREIAPSQRYELVEHTLRSLDIDMDDGIVFRLTGTLDRIRLDRYDRRGVADVKTGARAVDYDGNVIVDKHLPQLGEYELLAETELGPMDLPPAIIGLQTGGRGQVGIGEIKGARTALVGDEDRPGLLHFVKQYFKSGLFPPNPGSFMCSPKYCPHYHQCPYHG